MNLEKAEFEFIKCDLNSNLSRTLKVKHINGDVLIMTLKDVSQNPFNIVYVPKPHELLKEVLINTRVQNELKKFEVTNLNLDLPEKNVTFSSDGLDALTLLTRRMFFGGHYSGKSKISLYECIKEVNEYLFSHVSSELEHVKVLKSFDFLWNDWFFVDFESDSLFMLNNLSKELTIVLIRDMD